MLHDRVDRHGAVLRRRIGGVTWPVRVRPVVVEDVRVAYGATWALDGIDVEADAGTTLGVLGHNGAGKTTLIRVLTTWCSPTGGRCADRRHRRRRRPAPSVRRRIGVTGQYAGLDEFLTARENLELVGRLAGLRNAARRRAGELIERLRAARPRRPTGR